MEHIFRVVLFCVLVFISGCAGFGFDSLGASPSIFVEAEGVGVTQDVALKEAFRNAVQRASGVLIKSKVVLVDGVITSDQLNEHSAGLIKSYDLMSQSKTPQGLWKVEIGAEVSSTKLADQILARSQNGTSQAPKSDQMFAQASTIISSRYQGDFFLSDIAGDFPNGSFVVNLGNPKSVIDENRNFLLVVPYTITWSKPYLGALRETLEYVSSDTCNLFWSDKRYCQYDIRIADGLFGIGRYTGYKFSDAKQRNTIQNSFDPNATLVVSFFDKRGDFLFSSCRSIDLSTKYYDGYRVHQLISNDGLPIEISDEKVSLEFELRMQYTEQIKSVGKIEGAVRKSCS